MKLRARWSVLVWVVLSLARLHGTAFADDAPAPPNIIFIFTDDHAAHAMSCYGSVINETPNLDRIANAGMRFDNCLVTNALCGPSRAVILTGKYSHLNGFAVNGDRFDGSQQTFPKLLQGARYQTAVVGKWHLETEPTGFDYWNILIGQGPYYNPPMICNGERRSHIGYTTDIITDYALDWLQNERDPSRPFMLMYQHKAPHREWAPEPDYFSLYEDTEIPEPVDLFDDYETRGRAVHEQRMTVANDLNDRDLKLIPPNNLTPAQLDDWNNGYGSENAEFAAAGLTGDDLVRWKYQRYIKDYLRCVASVDDNVGRVLDYLDASGLAENTVVIYASDQGFFLGDHGWFDKRFMYEECYRMPFVVRWPGVVEPGSVNTDLVSNVDFAETFLDIAGVEIPDDMQGRSLAPLLRGETPADWRTSHYYHYYEFYNDRVAPHMVQRHCGVRTERHKLIWFYNTDEWELYDLAADPDEHHNLYGTEGYGELTEELKAELTRLQSELQVPDDRGSVDPHPPSLNMGN